MKKQFLALVLSLVLCLCLAAPIAATETDNLTPTEAAAYLKVLSELEQQRFTAHCASLNDFNGDGKPELLTVWAEQSASSFAVLHLNIWTLRNGAAVQLTAHTLEASTGAKVSEVGIARRAGEAKLFEVGVNPRAQSQWCTFLNIDGTIQETPVAFDPVGKNVSPSPLDGWECEYLFIAEGGFWFLEKEELNNTPSELQETLITRANAGSVPAAQGGNYTVQYVDYDGNKITITFETTQVEKCTVMYSDDAHYENEADGAPKPKLVTMVSVRPESSIKITGSPLQMDGRTYILARMGNIHGLDCFLSGQSAFELYSGPVEDNFEPSTLWMLHSTADAEGDPIYVRLGNAAATVGGFADVKATDYFAAPVEWAVEQGITTGTSASAFSPNATCTTGQILTFLWRANGSPKIAGPSRFTDVSASDYYYQAVLWASEKGLVSGSSFQGNAPCTRAATVTYLWKLAGQPAAGTAGFADVPAGAGYAPAVAWAVQEGITSGTSSNSFSPQATCTRGQIVTFLYRNLANQ